MQGPYLNTPKPHQVMTLKVLTKEECTQVFYSSQPIALEAYEHDRMEVKDNRPMWDPSKDDPYAPMTSEEHPLDDAWEEWCQRKAFPMRMIRQEWKLLA